MDSKLLPIQQLPGFVKDTESGAILNTDTKGIQAYRERKKAMRIATASESRLNQLEGDISDIKVMLATLMKKIDKT